ncbi:MAG: macro domain-containing protein [Nitrososphaerota archaeon]
MAEFTVRGLRFVVTRGDITEVDAEAIVVPANSMLVMGGGVAGAVKRRGGAEIEKEAMNRGPIKIGEAVATGAGKLRARYIIHSPTMEIPAGETDLEKVYKATKAAFKEASRLKLKTLAYPGMGTGVGGLAPKDAARQMIKAILDAAAEEKSTLEHVYLVAFDASLEHAFTEAVKASLEKI